MRIVDRATFLAMPSGTVYQKYQPCCFDAIEIKQDTCGNDWYELCGVSSPDFADNHSSDDFEDICTRMENGSSEKMVFQTICRDGYFDYDQRFAVWEPDDIKAFHNLLGGLIDG